jgi:hypothetical protein
VTGWTACARRIVDAAASESPKCSTPGPDQLGDDARDVLDRHGGVVLGLADAADAGAGE